MSAASYPSRALRARYFLPTQRQDLLTRVIATLRKYGGSLWLAGPAYCATSSDGNGAVADGGDVGFVRDLCATIGPELLTNGDFSQGITGWTVVQPTAGSVGVVNGQAAVVSSDGSNAYIQVAGTPLVVGRVYELACDYTTAQGSLSLRDSAGTIIKSLVAGRNTIQFVAANTSVRFNRDGACNCTVDDVSLREVRVVGPELFPSAWVSSALGNTVSQGVPVTRTLNADDSVTFVAKGTATATFIDPVNNLLPARVTTLGGESFEVVAAGSVGSVVPASSAPCILVSEGDVNGSYLRGTMVPFGTTKVVTVGADCKNVRFAVFLGSWTSGSAVDASFTVKRPSIKQVYTGRHLFQGTTAAKPKLKRVPKRLGPELVVNGDFSSGLSNWANWTAGVTLSNGALGITSTAGEYQGLVQTNVLTVGKTYAVQADVVITSGPGGVVVASGTNTVATVTTGRLSGVLNALAPTLEVKRSVSAVTATVDNISVREVLEWAWAFVYDGADDSLASAVMSAAPTETLGVVKRMTSLPPSTRTAICKSSSNKGIELYANQSVYNNSQWGTGTGYVWRSAMSTPLATHTAVVGAVSKTLRIGGLASAVNVPIYESAVATIKLGSGTAAFSGEIFAGFYAPTAMDDVDLIFVERALGALAEAQVVGPNLLSQALEIVSRYGGSFWIADPAYAFVGSEGVGAVVEGGDVGHVRDLCAVYGPERVVNGTFDVDTAGWLFNGGATLTAIGGTLKVAWASGSSRYVGAYCPGASVQGGKTYELNFDLVSVVAGKTLQAAIVGAQSIKTMNTPGPYKLVFTAINSGSLGIEYANQATGDGDGFVLDNISLREIIGRPLFQGTTAAKPKLKRVPKRLGPELVTNGNFSAAAGWVGAGASSVVSSGGVLTITSAGLGYAARAESPTPLPLTAGSTYILAVNTPSGGSFRLGSTQGQPQVYNSPVLPAGYAAAAWVATVPQAYISLTGSSTAGVQNTFTQASVREVLEWGWAWVFDGVDDHLAVGSVETPEGETISVAYRFTGVGPTTQAVFGKRGGNYGAMIRRETSLYTNGYAMTGSATEAAGLTGAAVERAVASLSVVTGNKRYRIAGNNVTVNAKPYVAAPANRLTFGAENTSNGSPAAVEINAAVYMPGNPSEVELAIVERALGEISGETI
jgi:hypothetical protein